MTFEQLVMVLGAPRSGTSWLGKIFDSHPAVLYRHEPDLALWDSRLPFFIPEQNTNAYTAVAAEYVARLMHSPTLKASGQLPAFPKSYQLAGTRPLRTTMINALRWIEAAARSRRMRSFPVPDLIMSRRRAPIRVVIKSVSARGRARVFLAALPGMRLVFLLRHPCGQVASTLRGFTQGRFNTGVFVRDVLNTPGARRYRLTEQRLNASHPIEQLAWHWATLNELVLDAMSGRDDARFVLYEDLCADPAGQARNLFAFAGLDWAPQTEDFIRRSTSYRGAERYFGVFRDAVVAANRWRSELSERDQRLVLDVVAQTSLAHLWPDMVGTRHAADG